MTSARPPRVAVVGVRRVHTGLGAFLAKHLVAHGAEVPAFIASRKETIEEGRWSLRNVGIDAEGFVDLDALLDAHPVDALVIASPHATHLAWLESAIDRGLHVLCEKPFAWADPAWWVGRFRWISKDPDLGVRSSDPPEFAASRRLLDIAAAGRLVVFENCPWPYVLPTFDALHPDARRRRVTTFQMQMAPSSRMPREMLVDVLSHPLSLLQEFTDASESRAVRLRAEMEEGRVELTFTFETDVAPAIAVELLLRSAPTQPRPMALAINGFRADRRLQMEDYSMSLADGVREVPLPDPMAALVGDFVRTIRHGEPEETSARRLERIASRLRLLQEIVGSFPRA